MLAAMLNDLKFNDVKATQAIRLGRRPESQENGEPKKPRALKVVLENEEQQTKLLKLAKNLRNLKEEGWSHVFIHQDYTPMQQKKRLELVAQMKARRDQGEDNLIIVDWKVVRRRMQ